MGYEVVKTSEFSRFTIGEPTVTFDIKGGVRFSKRASELIGFNDEQIYVRMLIDKKRSKIAMQFFPKVEQETTKMVIKLTDRQNCQFRIQSKPLIVYLKEQLDWPLEEGKLKCVKYNVAPKNAEGIFELI